MKRVLAAILVLILLCSASAFAAEDIFSGTILCPAVNGIQLGMSMPYVLLQEEYVNGNTPVLVSTLGNTLDEVAANDEADRYITYTIGMIDVFGAQCELAYSFADNVLFHASCTASFDSEEEALKWCDDMTALFCNYYGDSYNDLSDDEFFEDMVEYRDWTLYTSELPYNVVCEKDGVELNLLPREYLRSGESITCTVKDGKYVATATVAKSTSTRPNMSCVSPTISTKRALQVIRLPRRPLMICTPNTANMQMLCSPQSITTQGIILTYILLPNKYL